MTAPRDPIEAPATEAGREMLANLEPRWRGVPWDPVSVDMTRQEILAIEAEAAQEAAPLTCSSCGVKVLASAHCHDCYWRMVERGDEGAAPGAASRRGEWLHPDDLLIERAAPRAEGLDPRDVLLEFGQWLADNLSARRGMEEALDDLDEDAADMYAGTVDAFLASRSRPSDERVPSRSPHNREAGE